MLQPEKLFNNLFDDKNITSARLSNFTADAIIRASIIDTDGVFTDSTAAIVAAHTLFHESLSGIDTSLAVKKGKTMTVNEVKDSFGKAMSEYENEIARSLGGHGTPAYLAFYPRGVMEFSTANLTQMPILTKRIYTLATENAALLGTTLTAMLQVFFNEWTAAISEQSNLKGALSDGRADRSTLRTSLEIALLSAIHLVGYQFPGNTVRCMSFFDFGLLTGVSHIAKPILATIPVGQV